MKKVNLTIKNFVLIGLVMTVLAIMQVSAAGTRQRPFSDWLSAQGSSVNPSNCAASVTGWLTPDFATFARADYSGKIGNCITMHGGPVFNPEFSGTVTERDLPDGTAEILVIEHFANTYVVARDNTQPVPPGFPAPAILGFNSNELFGHPELQSAVASGMIQVKFIIEHPGDPLPDLVAIDFLSLSARFQGSGPLRTAFGVDEGTPGKVVVSQTGLFNIPGQGNGVADSFPAELVRVFKAGN
ncbi:MAG TPA: hypothetical protein VNB22_25145 [Pyrinomonadaceae bacterium]|jgi:hypothetical protein|nr:hypothetical protein [Pyrinomonadaceae bacterium]